MRFVSFRTCLLLVVGFALSLGMARADDFSLAFSNVLAPGDPIVGTGTFSFSENLGDGTYQLSSLTNVQFDFTIAGETFTTADVDTINAAYVEVVITNNGDGLYFATSGPDYGPYGGSLDFTNGAGYGLSTEPDYAGTPPLDEYLEIQPSGLFSPEGYYTVTPEPSAFVLLGTGLAGMILRRFKRT